jgi:L,D-peptidoglycan transpeptidase YkuD (ErfK/YbiS/YcfS/YnhG family)
MKRTTLDVVRVHPSPLDHRRGRLIAGPLSIPCALGRSGTAHDKREGDGASPVGRFRVLQALYRADRLPRPRTLLPLWAIRPQDGWCDDAGDRRYNRPIRLPDAARHERLWREDGLYDVVLDLAYNRGPIRPGRGSAIFLHCAKPGFGPTEGCVAIDARAARQLLQRIGPKTRIEIIGP